MAGCYFVHWVYSAPEQKSKFFCTGCLASIPISMNISKVTVNLAKNVFFLEMQTYPIEAVLYRDALTGTQIGNTRMYFVVSV